MNYVSQNKAFSTAVDRGNMGCVITQTRSRSFQTLGIAFDIYM